MKFLIATLFCVSSIIAIAQTDTLLSNLGMNDFLAVKRGFVSREDVTIAKPGFLVVKVTKIKDLDYDTVRLGVLVQWSFQTNQRHISTVLIEPDELGYLKERLEDLVALFQTRVKNNTEYKVVSRNGLEVGAYCTVVNDPQQPLWKAGIANQDIAWAGRRLTLRQLKDLMYGLESAQLYLERESAKNQN